MSGHDFKPGTKVSVEGVHFGRQDGVVLSVSETTYGIRFSWSDHTSFVSKSKVTFRGEPSYWEGKSPVKFGDIVRDGHGNTFVFIDYTAGMNRIVPLSENDPVSAYAIYAGDEVVGDSTPNEDTKATPKLDLAFGDQFALINAGQEESSVGNARSYCVYVGDEDYDTETGPIKGAVLTYDQKDVLRFSHKNVREVVPVRRAVKWDGELATLKFGVVCSWRGKRCVIADDNDTSTSKRDIIADDGLSMLVHSVPIADLRPADHDHPYYFGQKVYSKEYGKLGVTIDYAGDDLTVIAVQDKDLVGKIVSVNTSELLPVSPSSTYVDEHSDEPRNFGDVVRNEYGRYVVLNLDGEGYKESTGLWYGVDYDGNQVF